MKKLLFLFLFITANVFANGTIKDRLIFAHKGDYLVTQQNNFYSLIIVRDILPSVLILEEICIPSKIFNKNKTSFKDWARNGAKGHSSWMVYEIDLEENKLLSCYSVMNQTFFPVYLEAQFFLKLLTLPLKPIPFGERKKIGTYNFGSIDNRPIWNPSFNYEGSSITAQTSAYRATWPDDSSEYANKIFEMHFDENNLSLFPCWIQIKSTHLSLKVFKAIDMGRNLHSALTDLSHLLPIFASKKDNDNTISLSLSSSSYYQDFKLYAISYYPKKIIPIEFKENKINQNFSFEIDKSYLKEKLEKNRHYFWVAIPTVDNKLLIEDRKNFSFSFDEL